MGTHVLKLLFAQKLANINVSRYVVPKRALVPATDFFLLKLANINVNCDVK